MTQPALSKWLKELESDVGLLLFERHARGLRPTAHGWTLIEYATRVGNELNRARDEMVALKNGSSGRVVVGASGAAIASLVPNAVLSLLQVMPNANIEVVEAPMDRLYQQLTDREIDIAIGRDSQRYHDPDVKSEALYQERMHFAVRPDHPLARRRSLSWDELLSQRWVVWTRDIPARHVLESSLADAGLGIPAQSLQSNSLAATVALIVDSDMVAVVSERSIEWHERRRILRRLSMKLGTLNPVKMYWRHNPISGSSAVERLLAALRMNASQARLGSVQSARR